MEGWKKGKLEGRGAKGGGGCGEGEKGELERSRRLWGI